MIAAASFDRRGTHARSQGTRACVCMSFHFRSTGCSIRCWCMRAAPSLAHSLLPFNATRGEQMKLPAIRARALLLYAQDARRGWFSYVAVLSLSFPPYVRSRSYMSGTYDLSPRQDTLGPTGQYRRQTERRRQSTDIEPRRAPSDRQSLPGIGYKGGLPALADDNRDDRF